MNHYNCRSLKNYERIDVEPKIETLSVENESIFTHAYLSKSKSELDYTPGTSFDIELKNLQIGIRSMNENQVKIGIIGHGFVGKATDWGFDRNVEKFIVDPIYETNISDLVEFKPSIIFVCVPTPMANDGSQDASIFLEVIKTISDQKLDSIVVVKSTVLPDILIQARSIINNLVYNPEFLREKHAFEDFENSEMIIFGGEETQKSIRVF